MLHINAIGSINVNSLLNLTKQNKYNWKTLIFFLHVVQTDATTYIDIFLNVWEIRLLLAMQ